MNTESTLDRPMGSYSQNYLNNRECIYAYNRTHKNEIRIYMRDYMREYRKRPDFNEVHGARMALRRYLGSTTIISYAAIIKLGATREEIAAKRNMTVEQMVKMVKNREVDHIVNAAWIMENKPELMPFIHRHYNLQFIERKQNRTKGRWIDKDNPVIQHILCQMQLDLIKSQSRINYKQCMEMKKFSDEVARIEQALLEKN